VDKEHGGDNETDFYVLGLLKIIELMAKGKTHDEALKISLSLEEKERHKSDLFKQVKGNKKKEIEKVHKKLLGI